MDIEFKVLLIKVVMEPYRLQSMPEILNPFN